MDEDAPTELMLANLREHPSWIALERVLLEKRDRMVAHMVSDQPGRRPVAQAGATAMNVEDSGIAYARLQRQLGYIEALNVIVKTPADAQEKARKARIGA